MKVAADARGISAEQAKSLMSGNAHIDQLVKVLERLVVKDREVARRYGLEMAGATGSAASSLASEAMETLVTEEDGSEGDEGAANGTAEEGGKDYVQIQSSNVGSGGVKPSSLKKKTAVVS